MRTHHTKNVQAAATATAIAIVTAATVIAPPPVPAYSPVVIVGADASATAWSWTEDDSYITTGPYLDIDYRTPLGTDTYLGTWYTGRLAWHTGEDDIVDTHDLGFKLGGTVPSGGAQDHAWLLRASAALSSEMGDNTTTFDPEWSASWTHALADTWTAAATYSGLYRHDDGPLERYTHGADLEFTWEPTLLAAFRTGPSASMTTWPQWDVLDNDGSRSNARRSDTAAEYRLGVDGMVGFFTLWSVDTAAGVVVSNANRLVDGDVEKGSQDRTTARLDVSISSRPTRILGITLAAAADAGWYWHRTALDSDGLPTDNTARTLWTSLSVATDWRLTDSLYLRLGADGGRSFSNDTFMDGWTATATAGIEVKL
jgi:hypothetical protein